MSLPITSRLDRAIDFLEAREVPLVGISLTTDEIQELLHKTGRQPPADAPIRYRNLVCEEHGSGGALVAKLGRKRIKVPLRRKAFLTWLHDNGFDEPPPPFAPAAAKRTVG